MTITNDRDVSQLQYGKGSALWDYWTKGKGLALWSGAKHKRTTLHALLLKEGVPTHMAWGLTTNIIEAVMPGYLKTGRDDDMADDEFVRTAPFDVTNFDVADDGLNFSGYAAVFNTPTRISGWEGEFDEQISPGAFARGFAEKLPVLMFEHGRHPLIGSMPLGVINHATEDEKGLFIEARLTDNWLVRPVRDAVAAKAIKGMSFRFTVAKDGETWQRDGRKVPLRSLTDLNCRELGPVVFPAYEPTTAQVRSSLDTLDHAGRSDTRCIDGGVSGKARKRDRLLHMKGIL